MIIKSSTQALANRAATPAPRLQRPSLRLLPGARALDAGAEAAVMDAADAAQFGEKGLDLTILMPCLNEARTLPPCIYKALAFLARSGLSGEVLVADNGSSDGSQEIAGSLGA